MSRTPSLAPSTSFLSTIMPSMHSVIPRSQGVRFWYRCKNFVVLFGLSLLSLHDDTGVGGNTGPKLSSLLTDGTSDGGSLHLTLGVDDLSK